MRAVVLVEGVSDQLALATLAARRGRDLDAEGVLVRPIGGAHAVASVIERLRLERPGVTLAGLCDAREEEVFARALERAGMGADLTRADLESLGFFVCVSDLEDELVRALGAPGVQGIIEAQGELAAFRTFQKQPAKRALPLEEQLWRFMWNRKIRYAPLLVAALDLTRVPRPLDGVLAHV
jgi:Overcoming lysogenization defect protein-like, TOPRIM domain